MATGHKYITDNGIEFNNIMPSGMQTGQKIQAGKYAYDENGNIIKNSIGKIINAIEIDWNNAKVPYINNEISSTDDLLKVISNIKAAQKQTEVNTRLYIGENGNWFVDDNDTGISAIENNRNSLLPYIKTVNGQDYLYIGDEQICFNSFASNGLYIKEINGVKHWCSVLDNTENQYMEAFAGNTPYIVETEDGDHWFINGADTKIEVNYPVTIPEIINGYWYIEEINSGIQASANEDNSNIANIGENGNWFINNNDTGYSAIKIAQINNSGGDSNSLPIYDSETESRLADDGELPEKYISLGNEYALNDNVDMISHLLNIVGQLQNEVNKLKNTLRQGLYSYNNEATFMSGVVDQYGDDEEPLWAIDEAELDEIDVSFNLETQKIFEDNDFKLKLNEDQRMFLYFTTDNPNVNVVLNTLDDLNNLEFNFSDYTNITNKCNIMLIISRLPQNKDYPANYIYFTITDYVSNSTVVKGYLNEELLLNNKQISLNNRYYINNVDFTNAGEVYHFGVYSDDKALGSMVIGATPDEEADTYRVAHIAIRSCTNAAMIKRISKQLVNNELIFDEESENLYIKAKGKIINIGTGSGSSIDDPGIIDDDNMTKQEIIKALAEQGIISVKFKEAFEDIDELYDLTNIENYELNSIGSIKFIHEETGKTFEYKTNEHGELEGKLVDDTCTIDNYLGSAQLAQDFNSVRGVIGQVGEILYAKEHPGASLAINKDHILYSDRIKIGSIYAPMKTDIIHGCSHAYIELENTSDLNYNLKGCSLHYIRLNDTKEYYIDSSLKLDGTLKAGSTYLIRGKQYNDINDEQCYIKVKTYDQEWYDNGQLIDLTIDTTENGHKPAYVFILMYDNIDSESKLYKLGNTNVNENTSHVYLGEANTNTPDLLIANKFDNSPVNGSTSTNSAYVYAKGLIDAIAINANRYGIAEKGVYTAESNCIYKNTFELDPAKQAYNAMTKHDSSRQRWDNNATDLMNVSLNSNVIEFPKTDETYPVEYFTPKASFENKNVCTDKTKFNKQKPNAVSVSFGENIYTTRCFNWLSSSIKDEYVWLINDSNPNNVTYTPFESYKHQDNNNLFNSYTTNTFPRRKEYPYYVNNIVYCDNREQTVIDVSRGNLDVTYKEFRDYPRCAGLFAATNDFYVSHKCVIEFDGVQNKEVKKYIVGPADKTGKKPDFEHSSEVRSFNLYPETYEPRIYQITDQQGFHWVEYQVWAAAAIKVNEKIESDITAAENAGKPIIPIIINTGDATQSGSRVNEWLDYFNAGDVLFNHFEQNNIVGNNDLNGTDIQFLGTGDDTGKSNGYYYYLFNCCDVNNFFTKDNQEHYPITNGVYMPSLYYIQTNKTRIVLINSEFTMINCRDWFNLKYYYETSNGVKTVPVNIFTGYTNDSSLLEKYVADKVKAQQDESIADTATYNTFTPVYTLLWHAFNKEENGNRECIAACHEMPFTVITAASTSQSYINQFRSINTNGTSLVGSHMNQLNSSDAGAGVYWFSRLLESQGVKLCIGGHKHTYTSTYPLRENYKYLDNGEWKTSKENGPMYMGETLENEQRTNINDYKVLWSWVPSHTGTGEEYISEYQWAKESGGVHYGDNENDYINWSKLPLTYRDLISSESLSSGYFFPTTIIPNNDGYEDKAVIYVMCQATGYKLTSNKELPTPNQKFSRLVPTTKPEGTKDTPDNNQKLPMFMIYEILEKEDNEHKTKCKIKLARIQNIFNSKYKFLQGKFGTKNMELEWLVDKAYYTGLDLNYTLLLVDDNYPGDIVFLPKYEGDTTNYADDSKLREYDNYGLWVKNGKEHEMIPEITL